MAFNSSQNFIKKITIILLFTLPIIGYSQTSSISDDAFIFKLIDSTQDTKANLYTKARQFIALEFRNSNEVIQMDDKDAGKIIGKGISLTSEVLALGIPKESIVRFTVTIDVKDNKFRCIINDIYHDGWTDDANGVKGGYLYQEKPDHGLYKKWWERIKEDVKNDCNDFITRFDKAMKEKNAADNF